MKARLFTARITVGDLGRSLAFYTGIFGMKEAARLEFSGPDISEAVLVDSDGTPCLILMQGDAAPVHSGSSASLPFVLQVEDIHAAGEEVKAAGYELVAEPTTFGPLGIFLAVDPDGYLVEVVSNDTGELPDTGGRVPHPLPQMHDRKLV